MFAADQKLSHTTLLFIFFFFFFGESNKKWTSKRISPGHSVPAKSVCSIRRHQSRLLGARICRLFPSQKLHPRFNNNNINFSISWRRGRPWRSRMIFGIYIHQEGNERTWEIKVKGWMRILLFFITSSLGSFLDRHGESDLAGDNNFICFESTPCLSIFLYLRVQLRHDSWDLPRS